jgi:gas vesicle protein
MDAPNTVVEKVRAHQQVEQSIGERFARLEEKMPLAGNTILTIADVAKKSDLVQRFAQLGKHIERNIKAFRASSHKAQTVLKELKSSKPNWLAVERALDRALEIVARIDGDLKDHENALDDVLAACRTARH